MLAVNPESCLTVVVVIDVITAPTFIYNFTHARCGQVRIGEVEFKEADWSKLVAFEAHWFC